MAKARLFSKKPLFPDQVPTSCNSFVNPFRHVGKEWSQRLQRNDKPGGPVADLHKVLPPLPSPSFVGQLPSLCCRFNKRSSLLLANDRFAKFGSVRISCVRIPISPWATPIYRFSCQVQSGPAAMMRSMILFLISAKQEVRSGY